MNRIFKQKGKIKNNVINEKIKKIKKIIKMDQQIIIEK